MIDIDLIKFTIKNYKGELFLFVLMASLFISAIVVNEKIYAALVLITSVYLATQIDFSLRDKKNKRLVERVNELEKGRANDQHDIKSLTKILKAHKAENDKLQTQIICLTEKMFELHDSNKSRG